MSEDQEVTATAEATAEPAETQESPAPSEIGESQPQQEPQGYEPFVIPEGFSMNDEQVTDVTSFAKDLGLDQANAQKAVDKHFELMSKVRDQGTQAQEAMHQEWASAARTDKEFGGNDLQENLSGARKAMNSFSEPATDAKGKAVLHKDGPMKGQQMSEMEVLMGESGWGNHPAMIRVFHRINKAMSADSYVTGSLVPPTTKKTQAETLYPDQGK